MNRKLKKYAEKQSMLYRNEEFLEELKSRQRKKVKKNSLSNKRVASLCISLSVVLVTLTITLLCVFLNTPATPNTDGEPQVSLQIDPVNEELPYEIIQPKDYLGENRKNVESNLREINDSLGCFLFIDGNRISKYIDVQYNETLYYYLTCESDDELYSFKFRVFVNSNYRSDEMEIEYEKKGSVASCEIQYSETVNCDDDIYFFTESGRITTDREIILIDAEIIGFEEDSNFIELLNEIIQAK